MSPLYGVKWQSTAPGSCRTFGSASGLSAARQADAKGCDRPNPISGECKCPPLSFDSGGGRSLVWQRPSTDRAQVAVSGGTICGEGNADSDWPAKPNYFQPSYSRSLSKSQSGRTFIY